MLTDIGEYFVGAYLQLVDHCDFVDYNIRPPGGGLQGLEELDVVGLNFKDCIAIVCEVTTHIRGLLYKNNKETVSRIEKKHKRQVIYAKKYLRTFKEVRFQFWSPVVPKGYLTENLAKISSLELVVNGEYKSRVRELEKLASSMTHDARNPVFRMMQIMGHLRE